MRYFLENKDLKVEIDSFGAEVKSVLSKENNQEYMWYGNPKFWGRTSPVLFPFVGSVRNKEYRYQGVTYSMGQHGFARDWEHEMVSQTENEITFLFKDNEETRKKYPFRFELYISYELDGKELRVKWTVKNPDASVMHFSVGAHPAFLCPIHHEENKAGYKVVFDGLNEVHYHGIDVASGLSVSDDKVLKLQDQKLEITPTLFDEGALIIEDRQTKQVALEDSFGRRFITMKFDTPLFALWSPEKKNAPFICIEPWYGRCDAVDFDGELEQREYNQTLQAGETFQGGYEIIFG